VSANSSAARITLPKRATASKLEIDLREGSAMVEKISL
jgi:hypothetical protein